REKSTALGLPIFPLLSQEPSHNLSIVPRADVPLQILAHDRDHGVPSQHNREYKQKSTRQAALSRSNLDPERYLDFHPNLWKKPFRFAEYTRKEDIQSYSGSFR